MNNDKFENRNAKSGKKAVAILLVMVLLLCAVIGTTLAWLMDTTDAVVNTFTIGNIDIELTETGATENAQTFTVIPGKTIEKKADVTVKSGSEACWLFIEIVEDNDDSDWVNWAPDEAWTQVPGNGNENVYYIAVGKTAADVVYDVLKDDQVTISGAMTKDYADKLAKGEVEKPTLTFKAYAIQSELLKDGEGNSIAATGDDNAAKAWALVSANP